MDSKTVPETVFQRAASIAAIMTLLQSIVWIIFSVIGALAAWQVLKFDVSDNDFSSASFFPKNVINCYFPEDMCDFGCCQDLFMPGGGFRGTVIAYLVMSILWSVTSAMLLYNLQRWSKNVCINLNIWAVNTLIICLLDLVVTIIFGVDYCFLNKRLKDSNDSSNCLGEAGAPAVLMSLAARGYILWILNLIAALWLLIASGKIQVNRSSSVSSTPVSIQEENVYEEPMEPPETGPTAFKNPLTYHAKYNNSTNISHSQSYGKSKNKNIKTLSFPDSNTRTFRTVDGVPPSSCPPQQRPLVDETDFKNGFRNAQPDSFRNLSEGPISTQKQQSNTIFPRRPWVDVNLENSSQPVRQPSALEASHIFPRRPRIDVNTENTPQPIRNPLTLKASPKKSQADSANFPPTSFHDEPFAPEPDYDDASVFDSEFTASRSGLPAPDVTPPSTLIVENWRKQILHENTHWPQSSPADVNFSTKGPNSAPDSRSYKHPRRGYSPIT